VGGFNLIEFRGMHDFAVHPVPFSPERVEQFDNHLLVFFTGVKRRAEEFAARQVQRVRQNLNRLAGLRTLVDEGYDVLAGTGSLARFGALLHRGWLLKRGLDSAITNDTIDEIYRAGLEAGALGGKLLGAGGGGFLLLFVPPERHAAVRQRLAHLQEVEFKTCAPGSRAIHCGAQRQLAAAGPALPKAA